MLCFTVAHDDMQEMNDEGKLGVGGGGHSKFALHPKKKLPFKLSEKVMLSHNTRLFRFALQTPEHRLGLPIGQHMFFYAKVHPALPSFHFTAPTVQLSCLADLLSCLLRSLCFSFVLGQHPEWCFLMLCE